MFMQRGGIFRLSIEYWAHSPNDHGDPHGLKSHLTAVAEGTSRYAAKMGLPDVGYWLGFWHDLGKFDGRFQEYIRDDSRHQRLEHCYSGAVVARRHEWVMAAVIAAHHAGLHNLAQVKHAVHRKRTEDLDNARKTLNTALQTLGRLQPPDPIEWPFPPNDPACDFAGRMLLSCLVDADYLDTEAHFKPDKAGQRVRAATTTLQQLWVRFEKSQARLTGRGHDPLSRVRHDVYIRCLETAELEPGFFRLTVPTGGGKTRSSMGFALRHALRHGLDRVIVVIPYTSIIDQTARVYRDIFGPGTVLEHHSAVVETEQADSDPLYADIRLASDNWDAPIVVTTSVQFFDSLFANRPSRVRKLHNISRSVVILDEFQTVPVRYLTPVLEVLRQLVSVCGTSVVLCTATQPAVEESGSPYLRGLDSIRDIIPAPERLFRQLRRVQYECHSEQWDWERVAVEMRRCRQCLTVVNTRADARELLDLLDDPQSLHLSTLLCGHHRRKVLAEAKRRLATGEPCRLVSTQVVEAGVHIDFPVVFRAMGPLDRIVQAAGRCNREGKLAALGRVVVFRPSNPRGPRGEYRSGTAEAERLIASGGDLHDPDLYARYFRLLYQDLDTDARRVQAARRGLQFADVAERFRLIDQETVPVIVRYGGPDACARLDAILQKARIGLLSRQDIRTLQPYTVNLYQSDFLRYQRQAFVVPAGPVWLWTGKYDSLLGIEADRDPADLIV